MATLYSSAYSASSTQATSAGTAGGETTTTTTAAYMGPRTEKKGDTVTVVATYNLANGTLSGTNTSLVIADLPAGAKPLLLNISSNDADIDSNNDFTFNLGYTGSLTAIASADVGLQAGGEMNYTTAILLDIFDATTVTEGVQLILGRQAGDLNSTGTLYFHLQYTL